MQRVEARKLLEERLEYLQYRDTSGLLLTKKERQELAMLLVVLDV